MLRHAAVKVEKLTFVAAMSTLFPHIGEKAIAEGWSRLRSEATVEEIADATRPLHRLALTVQRARSNGRRWRS